MAVPLRIDLFADIACPWCYVGEHRLRAALARFPDVEVVQHWHPFQLNPDLEPGTPWAAFARAKFGGDVQAEALFTRMREVGAEVGIDFRFDLMPTAPNTLDAHRLILASQAPMQMADRLFRAYFSEGADLNDPDTLVRLAAEANLPPEQTRALLASDAHAEDVRESQEALERLGVRGVPFYVFDQRLAVSGAQPTDVFADVIRQAMEAAS